VIDRLLMLCSVATACLPVQTLHMC